MVPAKEKEEKKEKKEKERKEKFVGNEWVAYKLPLIQRKGYKIMKLPIYP